MYIKIALKCILKMHILGPTSALSKQDIWVEHGGLKFSYTTHTYCKVCEPLDLTHSQIQPKVFVPQNVASMTLPTAPKKPTALIVVPFNQTLKALSIWYHLLITMLCIYSSFTNGE